MLNRIVDLFRRMAGLAELSPQELKLNDRRIKEAMECH